MNDQVEETIRILKARLAMSEPMPEPPKVPTDWSKLSWLATPAAIVLGFALLVIGPHYLPSVDPTPLPLPPSPVVVVPVKIDPTDAIATLNGIRLDTERTKLLCDLVNAGEGTFALRYQPIGKAELTRTVVVSGDKPPVPPIPPEPEPPPVPPKPPIIVPDALKPAVEALKPYTAPRAALSKFYADFAKVLEFSDPQQLQTTAQVRDLLAISLKSFVATGVMGAAPKVGAYIDAYLATQVPLDDGPFDADKRTKLVAAYKVIAEVLK